MIYDNLKNRIRIKGKFIFYGDNHVSNKSENLIKGIFMKYPIDCVALELNKTKLEYFKKDKSLIGRAIIKIFKPYREYVRAYGSAFRISINLCEEKQVPMFLIDTLKVKHKKLSKWVLFKAICYILTHHISMNQLYNKNKPYFAKLTKKRDASMIKKLNKLSAKYNKILVVIGYAHLEPIIKGIDS